MELSLVEVEDGLRDSTADSTRGKDADAKLSSVQLFQRAEIQAFTISPPLPSLPAFSLQTSLIKHDRQNICCPWNYSQARI